MVMTLDLTIEIFWVQLPVESIGAFRTFYFSEILRKKTGAKREFYAASQIFSEK